jgi:hypothetical protein
MHLALLDQALLVRVQVFDGVFHRDNVLVHIQVDIADHRGERGGFTRSGRTGHQNKSRRAPTKCREHFLGQVEFLERLDVLRNGSECGGHRAALHVNVDTETPQPRDSQGKVQIVALLENSLLNVAQHGINQPLRKGGRKVRPSTS